jgi:ATP-dependent exoDNAse (exonuclease V) beta subunit
VALTRAKHGLYVITTTPKEKNPSANYSLLLHDALGAKEEEFEAGDVKATKAFEAGSMEWVNEEKIEELPPTHEKPKAHAGGARDFPRLERRLPSAHNGMLIRGSSLFDGRVALATRFGSTVHTVFECIEWWDDEAKAKMEALRESEVEAVEAVAKCMKTEEIAVLFRNDGDAVVVWRERAFELVMEGEICSVVFDRVIVREGHAEVIDFKTDRVKSEEDIADAVKRHRGQLEWYRRVLVQLTGLLEAQITCRLLFTHPRRVVTL